MKKGIILGIVFAMVITISVVYFCDWYNSVERRGINIDWDDPWYFNGELYYYTEWLNERGEKMEKWLPDHTALFMAEQREKGRIVYPGHW